MRPPHPEVYRQAETIKKKIVGGMVYGSSTSTDLQHMLVAAYWAGRFDQRDNNLDLGVCPPKLWTEGK